MDRALAKPIVASELKRDGFRFRSTHPTGYVYFFGRINGFAKATG
ncbi:hypothetical protein ABID59_002292 [Bradyrhizobium sp. S3.3.6]